jgi:phage tail protein X
VAKRPLNIASFDLVEVHGDKITVDLLVWRRYRIPLRDTGLIEATMDLNPHLSKIHRLTPFLPVGTPVRIPIDLDLLARRPKPSRTITLFGTTEPPEQEEIS